MISLIKYFIFSIVLFFLLHFESMNLGVLKISHVWKAFIIIFLFKYVLKKSDYHSLYLPLIFLSVLQILNFEFFSSITNAIIICFSILIFPILGLYFLRLNPTKINNLLLFFSTFFILSFIPYELGILSSINNSIDLSVYGSDDNFGKIGLFQKVHSASVATACSLLVLLHFFINSKVNKFFIGIVFVFGLYILIGIYVRTGVFMLIFGALPILFKSRKSNTSNFKIISILVSFVFLVGYNILSNETFNKRMYGQNEYYVEDSFETLGSGRGGMILASFDIFTELNIVEKMIGIGQTVQKKKMSQKLGISVIPHNGFLELLLCNGILGLSLFLYFLYSLRKIYKKFKHLHSSTLLKSLFYSFIVLSCFQTYNMVFMSLFITLTIALIKNEKSSFFINKHIKYEDIN